MRGLIVLRRVAAFAAIFTARGASALDTAPPIDRLLKPQRLLLEVFHEAGVPRLQLERVINGQQVSLTSLFAPGGIQIEVVYREETIPKPVRLVDPAWLEAVQGLQTPSTESVWCAGVVVVDDNDEGILSMMPDSQGRRMAVVYAKPNREFGGDASLGIFKSAAHELTHILNLHHADWEGTSFTDDSTIESYSSAMAVRWRLSEASLGHLRHAPDAFVRPGGVAFGVVLREHDARHQRTPDEQYTVVNNAEEVAPRLQAVRLIPPRSLGPIVLIRSELTSEQTTTRESVSVFLAVEAGGDGRLKEIVVTVSGTSGKREIRSVRTPNPDRQDLDLLVPLQQGTNRVSVRASDDSGYHTERELTLVREDIPGKLLAVVFGVQKYSNVRPLKHSLDDARGIRDLLLTLGLEEGRLFYKEDPDLKTLRSGLGTFLRQQAGPKDTAIVYFAGHGAAEIDPGSKEKDSLSKYLLPAEADLADLYATALPMEDISQVLGRVKAQTTLVILDACFSGSAGGRAVAAENNRATSVLDRAFLGRSAGAGRAILAASGANEAAQESDELGHGLFTFYLLEGLAGKADTKPDGAVNLFELVDWVVDQVKTKTGGKQTPAFWGEIKEPPVLWRRK